MVAYDTEAMINNSGIACNNRHAFSLQMPTTLNMGRSAVAMSQWPSAKKHSIKKRLVMQNVTKKKQQQQQQQQQQQREPSATKSRKRPLRATASPCRSPLPVSLSQTIVLTTGSATLRRHRVELRVADGLYAMQDVRLPPFINSRTYTVGSYLGGGTFGRVNSVRVGGSSPHAAPLAKRRRTENNTNDTIAATSITDKHFRKNRKQRQQATLDLAPDSSLLVAKRMNPTSEFGVDCYMRSLLREWDSLYAVLPYAYDCNLVRVAGVMVSCGATKPEEEQDDLPDSVEQRVQQLRADNNLKPPRWMGSPVVTRTRCFCESKDDCGCSIPDWRVREQQADFPAWILLRNGGASLESIMRLAREGCGRSQRLMADRFPNIAHDVLVALAALERLGLAHRDVKPDNILIDETTGKATLADLGLCRNNASCMTGRVVSFPYRAPELVFHIDEHSSRAGMRTASLTGAHCSADGVRYAYYGSEVDTWAYGMTLLRVLGMLDPNSSPHKVFYATRDDELLAAVSMLVDVSRDARFGFVEGSDGRPSDFGGLAPVLPLISETSTVRRMPWWTPDFERLVRSCFVLDPLQRPVPSDLLTHPFFTSCGFEPPASLPPALRPFDVPWSPPDISVSPALVAAAHLLDSINAPDEVRLRVWAILDELRMRNLPISPAHAGGALFTTLALVSHIFDCGCSPELIAKAVGIPVRHAASVLSRLTVEIFAHMDGCPSNAWRARGLHDVSPSRHQC